MVHLNPLQLRVLIGSYPDVHKKLLTTLEGTISRNKAFARTSCRVKDAQVRGGKVHNGGTAHVSDGQEGCYRENSDQAA